MAETPNFSIHARLQLVVHLPEGARAFTTMLSPDPDCGEPRFQIIIDVEADTTDVAKDAVRLVRERLIAELRAAGEGDT